jgi:hypothetical protein
MEHASAHEKRAIRRFALQLPVMVTAASGEQIKATAETKDVSSQGVCFYCEEEMPIQSEIEFMLTLPTQVTMTDPINVRCRGKVVRVENKAPEGKFAIAAAIDSYEFVADEDTSNLTSSADETHTL